MIRNLPLSVITNHTENKVRVPGKYILNQDIFKKISAKPIALVITLVVINLFFSSSVFAARKVTNITYGTQVGTATAGTGTSVTYTLNVTEGGSSFGTNADDILLTWASGTPTGVTWLFSSSQTMGGGVTTTTPTFTPNGTNTTITFTVTTTNATPAGTYGFTLLFTDNNGGGGPWTSTGLTLVVGGATPTISYTGSPFTYYTGQTISSLTPTVTNSPTSYSISPALPAGLAFSTSTGVISGSPTATSSATTYTVIATNASSSGNTTISITVLPSTISYTGSPYTFYKGTAISTLSSTEVGGNPTSYAISPALPAGLSINTTTGDITGTPTVTSGSAPYTVTATYIGGVTATASINITILAPTISYTGSPYTYLTSVAISSLTPAVTGTPVNYSISTALPTGLTFNTSTGIISGTPTVTSPATTYTVTANYAGAVTATTTINVTVNLSPPNISYTPSTNVYTVGTAITTLTPANSGGAAVSYSISPGLPAGLSFNTTTGVISGTPTTVSAATTYTITATNAGGTGNTTANLKVNPAPPVISYTPSTKIFTVGTAITSMTPANTGGTVVSYSIDIALPAGLSFNTTTGVISGTPTAVITATTFTITATNAGGTGSTTINLTVNPIPPVISYSPSTKVFTVGSSAVTMTPVNTGGTPDVYSVGPALPDGLLFDTTTGIISGSPTGTSPATTYTVSADNDGGTSITTVTISCVNPAAPIINYTPSTNTYTVGTAIATLTPTNTGGVPDSYSISIPLPAGLSFNTTTGVISGTPTAISAATTYTITATNAGGTGSATVNLTVVPALPVISYTPSTNVYTVGTAITALTPVNTGGAASSYAITVGGALPAGLSFNTTTGVISGTPTATSVVKTYTITATNATGTGSTTVTLSVNNIAPSITYSPGTVSYSVGATITPATPVNAGGAAASYAIITGTLPTGLSFNTTTGVISGTPSIVFPTTTFTIKATNAAGNSSTSLIITVSPQAPIISYTPSTNAYPIGAAIPTLAPTNTGGAVTGYSYASSGVSLTGASLSGPSLMTIDASGNIYVANYNNGTISKYNSSNVYIGKYTTGKAFTNPEGIVFDSAGNCYVEDTGAGAVYKFNSAGVYQSTIISGLNHPLGICIDASDNLYIATYVYTSPYTSSVTKYNTSGTLLTTLNNSQMAESDGVAVDGSGNIYVLNRALNITGTNKGYVTKYNAAGTYLGIFSSGYEDPLAISVDPSGNVFVADSHNNQVKIYNPAGVLLNTISGFNDVEGFVADANGNLYVSDYTNNTVKEFTALGGYHISAPLPAGLSFDTATGEITGTPTVVFPATTYTVIAYNITGSGSTTVTLSCYNSNDWIGITSTDWNTPSNWLANIVPTSADVANIGVNRAFTNFPNVLAGSGTTTVGSVKFGKLGGQAAGVVVNTGSTLNVLGAITYQSDANSALAYTATLSGAGTINANSISVIANTTLGSSYTETMASSVSNLNVAANISLTSSNSGAALFNSAFNLTGGTALLSGVIQTTNTASSTSSFVVVPATAATLQLANATALSGLSGTGTNTVIFNNTGATIQFSGAAQTVYTAAGITGLPGGVRYTNISFSGTGIKTAVSGNLNIVGDFTNTMANDASNYVNLSSSTVNFNGTTQNLAAGGGNGTTFYKVAFTGAGTKTMNSGQFYIASSGMLYMTGSSASTILATGGRLTLNSDATGSASIAAIPSGPSITGNVNVQRYITGGTGYRSYRLASSPVYAATVSSNKVYNLNYLQNSIYLTGAAGGGFDKTGNPTLYLFREDQTPSDATFISGNFWGISSITSAPTYSVSNDGSTGAYNLPVGNGFLFFFRGNRASATLATETQPTYTNPVSVTTTITGTLNQGQVIVHDWHTPASAYLAYTGSGAGTNSIVRGFNLVGNPYASTIDWEQFNSSSTTTGIYGNNVGTTVYELNPATSNYDTYQKGGTYTNHGRRAIVSGQGFFVLASNSSSPQLIFNESAKIATQNTGLNLFMSTGDDMANLNNANIYQHLRLQMSMDSVNTDDIYIGFSSADNTKFVTDEDAPYKVGNGKLGLASISSDNVLLAINRLPLPPGLQQTTIPLKVSARANGTYQLNMLEIEAIPKLYEVWLMDAYKKDSLDMRQNTSYAFDISADTSSRGSKRFQLVIRQNPALAIHLLNFTAIKATSGAQTAWKIENEENYTKFTVERSTDGGKTFNVLGGVTANSLGAYGFLDRYPAAATNMYRLKIEDLNGAISYSNVVTLIYGNSANVAKNRISLYPNPAKSTLNLTIDTTPNAIPMINQSISGPNINSTATTSNAVYTIKIMNALGLIVKTATTAQKDWQTNVGNLLPGTYIMQVFNNSDDSLVGRSTFVKL